MLEIYQTPLDILYLALSVAAVLIAIFLVMALYQLFRLLKNVNDLSEKAKDTVDLMNHYLWQPIKFMMMVMDKGKEMASKSTKRK